MLKKLSAALAALTLMICMPLSALADEEPTATDTDTQATTETSSTDDEQQAEYSLSVEMTSDPEECTVGDIIKITVIAANRGNTTLTGVKIYFEDNMLIEDQTLAPSETITFTFKLLADETDVDGGIVYLGAEAAELDAPVTSQLYVKVSPAEETPATEEETAQEEESVPDEQEATSEETDGEDTDTTDDTADAEASDDTDEPEDEDADEAEDEEEDADEQKDTDAESESAKSGTTSSPTAGAKTSNPKTGGIYAAMIAAAALVTTLGKKKNR